MLTIPWFVTKTFQDLFRLTPVPTENQQQQQQFQQNAIQCEQQQHYQQQPAPPPPHVRQTQVQQQQAPVKQQQVQQQQAPVKQQQVQQQQAPVKQQQVQQQQAPVKQQQVQQQQAPVKQQVQQQEAPVKQQQVPQQQTLVKQQVPQQQAPVSQPQVQQQQAPAKQAHDQQHQSQQKQTTTSSPVQTAHLHNDLTQQNPVRVQGLTPPKSPASEVSTDFTQAQTELSQHTSPEVRELHSSATSQLSEATPNASPRSRPAADLSLQTSSRTVVLRNSDSVTGGKMSFEWAQNQVEKFQFDFDQADKDKSGSLSFEEVYNVLQKVGFKGSKEEAQSIFRHLDRDQDKKISREEFKATLNNLPRLSIKEFVLRKTFLKLDKDGSGYLTKSEITDATKSEAGLDIAAEKISDLLLYLIKEDTDEKVSYEEFLHVFGVESAATVMRQVFAKLDTDGSGFLTKEEILEAVKTENELKLKADKISDLLIYWCKDQDKKISYNEFVDVWLQQKKEKPKK